MADRIDTIIANIVRPIPAAWHPAPKPRKTSKGVRPGTTLIDRTTGKPWVVVSCDALGLTLRVPNPTITIHRRHDGDWTDRYNLAPKAPRPRSRKSADNHKKDS